MLVETAKSSVVASGRERADAGRADMPGGAAAVVHHHVWPFRRLGKANGEFPPMMSVPPPAA